MYSVFCHHRRCPCIVYSAYIASVHVQCILHSSLFHELNITLHWCHNESDGVSNHRRLGCLLKRLFRRRRSKKTSKLRLTGLCEGTPPIAHKVAVTQKMFPFDVVIIQIIIAKISLCISINRVLGPYLWNGKPWMTFTFPWLSEVYIWDECSIIISDICKSTIRLWIIHICIHMTYSSPFSIHQNVEHDPVWEIHMMTSSNGNIFLVTGHLCGEFTGHRWIPRTKASDAELWYFLWFASE